jgi:putative sporulation protein YtaF
MVIVMYLILLISLALSLDSFSAGFTYGLRKIKVTIGSFFVLFLSSFVILYTAVGLGGLISHYISPDFSRVIGSCILIILGSWMVLQSSKEVEISKSIDSNPSLLKLEIKSIGIVIQILKSPTDADLDKSGRISPLEALLLGIALSLDSFAAGISISALGYNQLLTSLLISAISLCGLGLGLSVGRYLSSISWLNKLTILPGLILILIGFYKI